MTGADAPTEAESERDGFLSYAPSALVLAVALTEAARFAGLPL